MICSLAHCPQPLVMTSFEYIIIRLYAYIGSKYGGILTISLSTSKLPLVSKNQFRDFII